MKKTHSQIGDLMHLNFLYCLTSLSQGYIKTDGNAICTYACSKSGWPHKFQHKNSRLIPNLSLTNIQYPD